MSDTEKNKLDAMPDVVIDKIANHLSYADVESLRKSCSHLRGLVDLAKTTPKIERIELSLNRQAIAANLHFFDGRIAKINYKNRTGGCMVTEKYRNPRTAGHFFKNTNAASLFIQDFKTLKAALGNQQTPLWLFEFRLEESAETLFRESLLPVLAELPNIRTTKLGLTLHDPNHLLSILPLLSAEFINSLGVSVIGDQAEELNVDGIAQLEQWRRLERLDFLFFFINDPSLFVHISETSFLMREISPEQAGWLKEAFRNSATFKSCKIYLHNDTNHVEVRRALVPGIEDDSEEQKWNFRPFRQEESLQIEQSSNFLFFNASRLLEGNRVRWV